MHGPLVRRTVLIDFGGFDETMRDGCEDWDFWQRVLRAGYRFIPTNTVGGAYRMRAGSMRIEKAGRHSILAASILARAHARDERPGVVFTEPLGHYSGELARIKRLIRGVTLSSLFGNEAEAAQCLAMLPENSHWALDIVNVKREVFINAKIFAGGDDAKLASLAVRIDEITARVRDKLLARTVEQAIA